MPLSRRSVLCIHHSESIRLIKYRQSKAFLFQIFHWILRHLRTSASPYFKSSPWQVGELNFPAGTLSNWSKMITFATNTPHWFSSDTQTDIASLNALALDLMPSWGDVWLIKWDAVHSVFLQKKFMSKFSGNWTQIDLNSNFNQIESVWLLHWNSLEDDRRVKFNLNLIKWKYNGISVGRIRIVD